MKTMEPMDKQKAMRMAMNGRMCLLSVGIMVILVAVTTTMMYGINMILIAVEATKGTEEIVELMAETNMTVGMAWAMGACFLLTAIVEMFTGISAVRFSNRVDRAFLLKKIVLVLLGVEILMQIVLFFMRSLSLGMLFTAIALPLFMLWGVTRLCKLAEQDPERVYAVQTQKGKEKQRQESAAANGKSLRERAMMKASEPKPVREIKENAEQTPEKEADEESVEQTSEKEADEENAEQMAEREADEKITESTPENGTEETVQ